MQLKYMSMDGGTDKQVFIRKWDKSMGRKATFLQTHGSIFMMPYGFYDHEEIGDQKFTGTHREHKSVERDFEITDAICGSGYLKLSDDKKSCSYERRSMIFGGVEDTQLIVDTVNSEFFTNE